MMGTTALVIELALAALKHATELNQLLANANAEGRDVTPDELAAVRGAAIAAVVKLDAAIGAAAG